MGKKSKKPAKKPTKKPAKKKETKSQEEATTPTRVTRLMAKRNPELTPPGAMGDPPDKRARRSSVGPKKKSDASASSSAAVTEAKEVAEMTEEVTETSSEEATEAEQVTAVRSEVAEEADEVAEMSVEEAEEADEVTETASEETNVTEEATAMPSEVAEPRQEATVMSIDKCKLVAEVTVRLIDKGKGVSIDKGKAVLIDKGKGVLIDKGKGVLIDKGKGLSIDKGKGVLIDKGKGVLIDKGKALSIDKGKGVSIDKGKAVAEVPVMPIDKGKAIAEWFETSFEEAKVASEVPRTLVEEARQLEEVLKLSYEEFKATKEATERRIEAARVTAEASRMSIFESRQLEEALKLSREEFRARQEATERQIEEPKVTGEASGMSIEKTESSQAVTKSPSKEAKTRQETTETIAAEPLDIKGKGKASDYEATSVEKPKEEEFGYAFKLRTQPAKTLRHAIAALSDPEFNPDLFGLMEVGVRGFQITVHHAVRTETRAIQDVFGSLRLCAEDMLFFDCPFPRKKMVPLDQVYRILMEEARDHDYVNVIADYKADELLFAFTSPTAVHNQEIPTATRFRVPLLDRILQYQRFPDVSYGLETILPFQYLSTLVKDVLLLENAPPQVRMNIQPTSMRITLVGDYDIPRDNLEVTFEWTFWQSLRKAMFLDSQRILYLTVNPPEGIMIKLGCLIYLIRGRFNFDRVLSVKGVLHSLTDN